MALEEEAELDALLQALAPPETNAEAQKEEDIASPRARFAGHAPHFW